MKRIKENYLFLDLLANASRKQKRSRIKNASKSQILSLCEICLNVVKGNVPVKVNKLRKYKTSIRKIANRTTSLNQKKKILINQSGGFLPIILPAILSTIGGLISTAIGKRL